MIEHPVDKANRALNEVKSAAHQALVVGDILEYKDLKAKLGCMLANFTGLLLYTLKDHGYDARAYAQGSTHVYVKIGSHSIDVWLYGMSEYNVRFRPSDTQYELLTALLPAYGGGIYTSSILQVMGALREIDTTIRTYEQCTTCHYSSVGAMGHGNHYYCGMGAVPVLPQCSQYQHYPMQALLSWAQ